MHIIFLNSPGTGGGRVCMRISEYQKNTIVSAVQSHDAEARIWLFGSRADDSKKGGDIDIGILSQHIGIKEKMHIYRLICDRIGDQKIDIVVSKDAGEAFFKDIVMDGIPL